MRFKSSIRNISTFTRFAASLSSLGKVAWVRLDTDSVRFTIIPEQGTQVWAVLSIDTIFESYNIQSAAPNNTINLELPIVPLHRALKSALSASSASLRLTKKDNIPMLSLTIVTNTAHHGRSTGGFGNGDEYGDSFGLDDGELSFGVENGNRDRETVVTQDIPVRVLSAAVVEGIHEPRCREPDVHILLPSLIQLKAISDRFTRLATATSANSGGVSSAAAAGPKLELSANMQGCLRLSIATDALSISSVWNNLSNPELDPAQVDGGLEGLQNHPSTRMKQLAEESGGEEGWAKVRIDGRDWGRVLSVGRLGGRVIACFAHEHALILYVYLSNDDDGTDDSVLTYYISSYSS
ncbi:MAG: hypothetical protein M1833_001369 [Piccolia ochrophora]|nr:MAG: hypothetical protein M1833_001369 [Piccolia ochrophora]